MLSNPAASTAAAADVPTGTVTVRPSIETATAAPGPSGRGRNIEPPCRKALERGIQLPRRDDRREQIGVRRSQGDAAVAIGGEGAGKLLRLVVDRQPVGRHD